MVHSVTVATSITGTHRTLGHLWGRRLRKAPIPNRNCAEQTDTYEGNPRDEDRSRGSHVRGQEDVDFSAGEEGEVRHDIHRQRDVDGSCAVAAIATGGGGGGREESRVSTVRVGKDGRRSREAGGTTQETDEVADANYDCAVGWVAVGVGGNESCDVVSQDTSAMAGLYTAFCILDGDGTHSVEKYILYLPLLAIR